MTLSLALQKFPLIFPHQQLSWHPPPESLRMLWPLHPSHHPLCLQASSWEVSFAGLGLRMRQGYAFSGGLIFRLSKLARECFLSNILASLALCLPHLIPNSGPSGLWLMRPNSLYMLSSEVSTTSHSPGERVHERSAAFPRPVQAQSLGIQMTNRGAHTGNEV